MGGGTHMVDSISASFKTVLHFEVVRGNKGIQTLRGKNLQILPKRLWKHLSQINEGSYLLRVLLIWHWIP